MAVVWTVIAAAVARVPSSIKSQTKSEDSVIRFVTRGCRLGLTVFAVTVVLAAAAAVGDTAPISVLRISTMDETAGLGSASFRGKVPVLFTVVVTIGFFGDEPGLWVMTDTGLVVCISGVPVEALIVVVAVNDVFEVVGVGRRNCGWRGWIINFGSVGLFNISLFFLASRKPRKEFVNEAEFPTPTVLLLVAAGLSGISSGLSESSDERCSNSSSSSASTACSENHCFVK